MHKNTYDKSYHWALAFRRVLLLVASGDRARLFWSWSYFRVWQLSPPMFPVAMLKGPRAPVVAAIPSHR